MLRIFVDETLLCFPPLGNTADNDYETELFALNKTVFVKGNK